MRHVKIIIAALLLASCATTSLPPRPESKQQIVTETLHGVEIADPFRWLEDQQSPATRDWITRQNAYTDAVLGKNADEARFHDRVMALLNTDQYGTPAYAAGRYFFTHRAVGEDLFSIYMREGANGRDVLLIDPAPLSADHTTSVGRGAVSNDGKWMTYFIRKGGADEVEWHFFDVDAKKDIGVPLPMARYGGVSLTPDAKTIYFTRFTKEAGGRVYKRAIDGGAEEKIFGDGYGPEAFINTNISDDDHYLVFIVSYGSAAKKSELYIKDLRDDSPIRTVIKDLDVRSSAQMAGDTLVIETNWNAPNERVLVANAANPTPENWKEIIPENPKAAIQDVSIAGDRVYVSYLEDVKPRVIGYDLEGHRKEEITFPTVGSLASISGTWGSPVAFYSFSSFALPPTIYQYDTTTGQRTVFAQRNAPVNPDDFTVEQVWYPSKDGTRIPMFLFYKKGLRRNGKNPTYLTGYGGFLLNQLPNFSPRSIAWAEQGGLVATANLRGGGEFGEKWHHAGMLDQKQNTFDDFIAAGEYLAREHYTSPSHLGIAGNSNGGLLVSTVATQRPDLMKAVVCSYPLIDMIRYHQFLVAKFWVPEYGSSESEEQFRWIYAYSPYQHVKQGAKYPAMLFITGDADTRVAPLHARKMTALMQAWADPSRPVLLRYHEAGGHSGGEPLAVQVKNLAEEMGFLWWQLK